MSMVNLKKTFEDCAAKMGDRLISAVVGFHYDDKDTYESTPSNSRLSRGPMRARRSTTSTTAASAARTAMP
jgi:hypothetical protein